MSTMNPEQVKAMWSERAATIEASKLVTHADGFQRELEINELSRQLQPSDVVLDMGAGNGWATVRLAQFCFQLTGADYSEEMIQRASAEHAGCRNVVWKVANALAFDEREQYDVVVTVRCLINILDWSEQQKAITNLFGALKPGGRLLMMEGVAEGRAELNILRQRVGLQPMPPVPHNLDFGRDALLSFLRSIFSSAKFSANGLYDLITRVVYPSVVAPHPPEYGSRHHEAALAVCNSLAGLEHLSRWGLFKAIK